MLIILLFDSKCQDEDGIMSRMRSIVLASESVRRKKLLEQLGLKFKIVPSEIEERFNPRLKPRGQAETLSLQKAKAVFEKYLKKADKDRPLIIAADTVVAIGDEVLGKPKNDKEAKIMLIKLSGKAHIVVTGYTIIDCSTKKIVTDSAITKVKFRKLSEREIKEYVKAEKLSDKAGAYAIQGLGAVLIEKIEGDYNNVVGLPLHALALELRKFGVKIL